MIVFLDSPTMYTFFIAPYFSQYFLYQFLPVYDVLSLNIQHMPGTLCVMTLYDGLQ